MNVFKIIAVVVLVLAIIAIVLLIPGVGEALAGMFLAMGMTAEAATALVATISTVAEISATVLTAFQATFDGFAAATGKESWTNFALDIASLATFGMGIGASKLVESVTEGAEGIGKVVAAGRAGRAEMGPFLGLVYSLGSRSAFVEGAARLAGLGGKFDDAMEAAEGARTALETALKEAEPGTATLLWTKSEDIAEGLAKLAKISDEVPGVLRVEVARGAATGVAAINAGAQWGSFVSSNGYDLWSSLNGGSDAAAIAQAVAQFRQAESHVP